MIERTVALVIGGACGMGAVNARELVARGALVVIADTLDRDGKLLAEELGENAIYVHLDVTSDGDWGGAVETAEAEFGPVNLLINHAGIVSYGPVELISPDEFRRVVDTNLVGSFLGMHFTVPSMRKAGGGVIVNCASIAGLMGNPYTSAYGASKWGVRGMTRSVAAELESDNIRVISVHLGPTSGPITVDYGAETMSTPRGSPRSTAEEMSRFLMTLISDSNPSDSEWILDQEEYGLEPVLAGA